MQRTAFCILSDAHSRLPLIGFGVASLATPCDKQPFASFLMLTQGFCSLALVLLFLQCWVANSLRVLSDAHSPG
jgi:hypothetical protein